MSNVAHMTPNTPAPIAETGFPVTYEEARTAMARVETIDECRTLDNKAAAMQAYAKAMDDQDLFNRARRIQAWAKRRHGELELELYPDRSKENLKQNQPVVRLATPHKPVNAPQERPDDGVTAHQRRTSRQIAKVPEPVFREALERETPASVSELADLGRTKRVMEPGASRTPLYKPQLPHALKDFANFCESTDPEHLGSVVSFEDRESVRELVVTAERWLRLFIDSFPVEE